MGAGRDGGRPSFLGRPVPDAYGVRRVVVAPGTARLFDEAEWRDAIVMIESGKLELECRSGRRYLFRRGDVLWLVGLPLRALHNRGRKPTVLLAVSRRELGRVALQDLTPDAVRRRRPFTMHTGGGG
jgi:hypothetical protein